MELAHQTVLLDEAIDALQIGEAGFFVDATYGRGGHSRAILSRLGPKGRLLVMDRDPEAIAAAEVLASTDARVSVAYAPFSTIAGQVDALGMRGKVDGLLMDLGVSSPQLDDAARGFSFMRDGPLDMRMDSNTGEDAAAFIARADVQEMQDVFSEYGEERFSRRIAQAIVRARAEAPLQTTRQLAEVVAAAVPSREAGKHPATRVFQALRIYVNRELDELATALTQATDLLALGGRLVVISFHSLEDRVVKRFMQHHSRPRTLPRGLPAPMDDAPPRLVIVGKALRPSDAEVAANPRARSAILRVAEVAFVPAAAGGAHA